jgi:uncharacterized membrane protein
MRSRDIKMLLATAFVLVGLDAIVISLVMKPLFDRQVQLVQGSVLAVDPIAAVLSYLVLVLGVYIFLVAERKTLLEAFLLGVFVYSTYELTSKSILRQWKWQTVVIDSLWGGTLFALTTGLTLTLFGSPVRWLPVGFGR